MKIEVLFFSVKRLILFKRHEEDDKENCLSILDIRCNRIIYSDEMDFKFKRIWKA